MCAHVKLKANGICAHVRLKANWKYTPARLKANGKCAHVRLETTSSVVVYVYKNSSKWHDNV